MDNRFVNWDYYTSATIEGRLLIVWRKGYVRTLVIVESPQLVHCFIQMLGCEEAFCATFIYGYNTSEERKSLWADLTKLKFPVKSWLILGDFNDVFKIEDRVGGNPITLSDTSDPCQWLMSALVDSIPFNGSKYTWSNNQDGQSRIYSKIDHAFANEYWFDSFPNSKALFSWETISDHCSCTITTMVSNKIGYVPFRYYNFWSNHADFKATALQNWKKPMVARGMLAIYLKLMRLKHCLKIFNKDSIGDIGKTYQAAKDEFLEAKLLAQAHPKDPTFLEKEKQARVMFLNQEKMYHSFLRQRSKISWLHKGDENTSFFHACLKKRKMENRILSYTTEQGVIIDYFPKVVDHFVSHFRSYMGSRSLADTKLNLACIDQGPRLDLKQ
ncbi:hypothetical protein CsatB_019427 [Cannabis sativa]